MASKMFALVLVAFVASQMPSGETLLREALDVQQRGQEEAEAILQKLLDLITITVIKNVGQLLEMLHGVKLFASDQVNGAKNILSQISDNSLKQISDLKNTAIALGIDVKQCVGEQEDVIKNLPAVAFSNIKSCVEPKLKEANTIVSEAIEKVNGIVNTANDLGKELKECGGITSIICYGNVITKATLELTKVPLQAVEIIAETTKMVAGLKIQLVVCASDQVETTTKIIAEMTTSILTCLSEAIAGKTM